MTALQWKKDIFAVTLSSDADVWLKSPNLVSKTDGKKLEQEPWFICFLMRCKFAYVRVIFTAVPDRALVLGGTPHSFSLL